MDLYSLLPSSLFYLGWDLYPSLSWHISHFLSQFISLGNFCTSNLRGPGLTYHLKRVFQRKWRGVLFFFFLFFWSTYFSRNHQEHAAGQGHQAKPGGPTLTWLKVWRFHLRVCDLGQVTYSWLPSVSSSIKWDTHFSLTGFLWGLIEIMWVKATTASGKYLGWLLRASSPFSFTLILCRRREERASVFRLLSYNVSRCAICVILLQLGPPPPRSHPSLTTIAKGLRSFASFSDLLLMSLSSRHFWRIVWFAGYRCSPSFPGTAPLPST